MTGDRERRRQLLHLGQVLTPQRLRALELLAFGCSGVTELSRLLGRSMTGTYRHLDRLAAAGVIEQTYGEDGRRGPIRVNFEALRGLIDQAAAWVDTLAPATAP